MSNLKQKRFVDTDYFHEQLDSTTVEVEGSHISATETKIGYTTDIEIHGNTVQNAEDLADIRSVGEKIEGQELYEIPVLSRGKNLFDGVLEYGGIDYSTGKNVVTTGIIRSKNFICVKGFTNLVFYSAQGVSSDIQFIFEYDVNMNFIKHQVVYGKATLHQNTSYIKFKTQTNGTNGYVLRDISDYNIQIEEGTVATPYEPYQEDKLTILSPTPLEKVGDVADRIICKDGVWGVEKWIGNVILDGSERWELANGVSGDLTSNYMKFTIVGARKSSVAISDKLLQKSLGHAMINKEPGFTFVADPVGGIRLVPYENFETLANGVEWLKINKLLVKYQLEKSQFIPLPHDQQIKLRTFANKTNISFLTEIEGYIKCKVPKSVGGTLESLVEKAKITDDRIEMLETVSEGNNMKYSTDKGVIHCKDTRKGRVNDLTIEGNTMVNYCTDGSKTLTLNGDINEVGTHITTTNAVNNGLVDVMCEGETLVNVCNQKDPIAITKAYTVENTNHVPLQGDYDGKARPVVEGNTLVNLCNKNSETPTLIGGEKRQGIWIYPPYTPLERLVLECKCSSITADYFIGVIFSVLYKDSSLATDYIQFANVDTNNPNGLGVGQMRREFTPKGEINRIELCMHNSNTTSANAMISDIKLYPKSLQTSFENSGSFEGLKSSFEDQLVTDENDPNYGKYRVEYKVTGKNKIDIKDYYTNYSNYVNIENGVITGSYNGSYYDFQLYVYLQKGVNYILSCTETFPTSNMQICKGRTKGWEGDNTTLGRLGANNLLPTIPETGWYTIHIVNLNQTITNLQIEEGSSKTTYEEYKEYTKTFYLNSPLLEGDTIEDVNGKATHIKRYGQVVLDGSENWGGPALDANNVSKYYKFVCDKINNGIGYMHSHQLNSVKCDSIPTVSSSSINNEDVFGISCINKLNVRVPYSSSAELKAWLQSKPITVVYELASPIYEKISEESILTDSYVNGHLDLDTNVTVNKVDFHNKGVSLKYLYPSTKYILQFNADNNGILYVVNLGGELLPTNRLTDVPVTKGLNRLEFTTAPSCTSTIWFDGIGFNASNISVVATEREFDYFEGLYSVGQDDENGHNIEITSHNDNYWEQGTYGVVTGSIADNGSVGSTHRYRARTDFIPLGTTKSITYNLPSKYLLGITICNSEKRVLNHYPGLKGSGTLTVSFDNAYYVRFVVRIGNGEELVNVKDLQGKVQSNVLPYQTNTKTLSLKEPLRSLPNGVKDKIVKIGGKWYIERNCAEIDLSSFELSPYPRSEFDSNNYFVCRVNKQFGKVGNNPRELGNIICGHMISSNLLSMIEGQKGNIICLYTDGNTNYSAIYMMLELNKINALPTDEDTVKCTKALKWLKDNNVKSVYQLATPVYEELTVDPTLTTYVDQTHISTNSVIPCNMKVKNSGYSTIIKPSTLYTVALDTNKSGEVKVNLGGAEKTTTNNILTLTTPSTLVDDSLRISGKGLTSKNVRLLEGDKTNFIPSYFEGLKSSFEEKQGDNHIVEVISESGEKSNKIQFSTLAPLRSVGDISDKLVFKDNKWMIERNCKEVVLDGSESSWTYNTTLSTGEYAFIHLQNQLIKPVNSMVDILCDILPVGDYNTYPNECISRYANGTQIVIKLLKFKLSTLNANGLKEWLSENPVTVAYKLAEPYYEEIGEYKNLDSYDEGTTIYANTLIAPKNLSFNLATHMSNIVKDVQDDVSDLKTWRSEVFDSITHKKTFGSGITTIEDTKEGVIDEVKLEGKTLVNLCDTNEEPYLVYAPTIIYQNAGVGKLNQIKPNTKYTVVALGMTTNFNGQFLISKVCDKITLVNGVGTFTSYSELDYSLQFRPHFYGANFTTNDTSSLKLVILEGDYTNNPPSFFEGLMSVGEDTDEIVVSSVNENLFDISELTILGDTERNKVVGDKIILNRTDNMKYEGVLFDISHLKNDKYYIYFEKETNTGVEFIKEDNEKLVWISNKSCVFEKTSSVTRIGFSSGVNMPNVLSNISLIKSELPKECVSRKQDKKHLLYYNEETQSWEKPVLREWDSIEKHSDGKYYYHQRSAEVVLNGSENWIISTTYTNDTGQTDIVRFQTTVKNIAIDNSSIHAVCDKFTSIPNINWRDVGEHIETDGSSRIGITIQANKLVSTDVAGFKQWLQANPVTVVYELAQEKVYEVADIQLNSYDGETNIIVNSGAISPITTVSLTSNLPKVAENLRNRVRQLEEQIYNYKVTQNLRQLRTFYKSDYANFGVATVGNTFIAPTSLEITPYGYDLFELFKEIISEGKDCYDRIELEEYIDFYVMTFIFDFEMAFELFDMIDSQHLDTEIEDEPIEDEENSEIIEDEPIDPDFSVDYEEPTIEEDIDVEMGVIPEDDLIDVEMGVIPNDDLIDIEMGVIPNEDIDVEFSVDVEEDQTKDEDLEV